MAITERISDNFIKGAVRLLADKSDPYIIKFIREYDGVCATLAEEDGNDYKRIGDFYLELVVRYEKYVLKATYPLTKAWQIVDQALNYKPDCDASCEEDIPED